MQYKKTTFLNFKQKQKIVTWLTTDEYKARFVLDELERLENIIRNYESYHELIFDMSKKNSNEPNKLEEEKNL